MLRTFRVVVADGPATGDDRGGPGVARGLRDAGFEVIVVSSAAGVAPLAEAALQEDADAIALAPGGDAPTGDVPSAAAVEEALAALGLDDVAVVVERSVAEFVARLEQARDVDPPGLGSHTDS